MSARRAAAFLNSIPTEERLVVHIHWASHGGFARGYGDGGNLRYESVSVRLEFVDLLGKCRILYRFEAGGTYRYPA